MTMTDPIADLLTRIRNGQMARHKKVQVPYSRIKDNILSILKDEGFIKDYRRITQKPCDILEIELKYYGPKKERRGVIHVIKRVSKPGSRVYVSYEDLPDYVGGFGIQILTTSKGVMTGKKAKELKVGGEIICEVW